ncbi:uncharacterized protein LOC131068472 isoform X2 [Cryptomeria japonica]|uniref:uncharacterized protein LOC131068472 isoform X2 n=1 Tax=Cryptomeria japonica TaxID=3369 RepID=UPI0025AC64F4|nr:uncharacterized protein LOC131068472 isoform X2 [Cryptomeria japonica]
MDTGSPTQSTDGGGGEGPELVCLLESVQGLVDALSSVRWKRQQDALVELSEHGIVIIVEERGCLQAKVYFRKELFRTYSYNAEVRPRFGVGLGLLVDCLNTFTLSGGTTALELRYPGPDMQLLFRSSDLHNASIYAEIRTRIPDTIPWDYNAENMAGVPVSFAVKSAVLKEAIDDLEWPGSSIQLSINPDPPVVTFKGEGHGDLQCDRYVSYRYKYKFLRATTANIPTGVLKDNRGSKLTIGTSGLLKIQHLVSVRPAPGHLQPGDSCGNQQQQNRISYIEFFVKPEEDDEETNDS